MFQTLESKKMGHKEKKISITHYLNTNLKSDIDGTYSVYIKVIYEANNIKKKSRFITKRYKNASDMFLECRELIEKENILIVNRLRGNIDKHELFELEDCEDKISELQETISNAEKKIEQLEKRIEALNSQTNSPNII
jgi:hypothetical protein